MIPRTLIVVAVCMVILCILAPVQWSLVVVLWVVVITGGIVSLRVRAVKARREQ